MNSSAATRKPAARPALLVLLGVSVLATGASFFFRPAPRPAAGPHFVVFDSSLPRRAWGRDLHRMLMERRFAALDSIAAGLRDSLVVTDHGMWKLHDFYWWGFDEELEGASEERWQQTLERLREWRVERPSSITAPVAMCYTLTAYAWNSRGTGYANTVSKKEYGGFEQRLREAHAVLDDAEDLPERCPVWYRVAQTVALGEGWEPYAYSRVFDEAVARYPGYPAYYAARAYFLLPRWYGRPGDWERFAEQATHALGTADSNEVYAWVVVNQLHFYSNIFKESGASWERTRDGLESVLVRYPESRELRSQICILACLAGDRATAREQFQVIGRQMDKYVWRTNADYFLQCWAWAMSGPPA